VTQSVLRAVFLASSLAVAAVAAAAGAVVGEPAPGFTLSDSAGHEVSLGDLKGKVVVLEWTNPDCPFVQRHYREGTMKRLETAYADRGVVWLTVNSTHYMDAKASAAFAETQKIDWPILVDQDGAVGRAYGAQTTPHMYIIDGKGTVVYAGAIDDDPRGSEPASERTDYVAKALDEVLAGKAVSTPETKPYGCSVKYKK
jgi:peroxiredoxin